MITRESLHSETIYTPTWKSKVIVVIVVVVVVEGCCFFNEYYCWEIFLRGGGMSRTKRLLLEKVAFSLETSSATPERVFVVGRAVSLGILTFRTLQKRLIFVNFASRLRGRVTFLSANLLFLGPKCLPLDRGRVGSTSS